MRNAGVRGVGVEVTGPRGQSIGGKVHVRWQRRTVTLRGRRARLAWRTLHKRSRPANRPFAFVQRIRRPGRWRVRVDYAGQAPLKPSRSRYLDFRVR